MSKTYIVTSQNFSKAMEKLLVEYGDHAFAMAAKEAQQAARGATSELKSSAPSGGAYARGWSHKAERDGVTKYAEYVYNRGKHKSLTHLLEKPHDTGNGGSYPSHVDYTGTIARVEEEYKTKFMEGIISKL